MTHTSSHRRPRNGLELWLDERFHILPAWDFFRDHPVPLPVHPLDYLGEATLFAFLNQAITGILLAMFYHPVSQSPYPQPSDAYLSIETIMHSVPFGAFVRNLHFWGNYFMVILVIMHALR